ncbi:unnamed protein product [Linum tenue]|uniref:Uncharacterized protein n=1 Tax=Linum tenue TaxID=586396 RepID=A0AAV0NU87_9ROSI|nr:unnamed protein product [Linum tenue]
MNYEFIAQRWCSCAGRDRPRSSIVFGFNYICISLAIPTTVSSQAYEKGRHALRTLRHVWFNWEFVDPKTPVHSGVKLCFCVKEFVPWLMVPLQAVYVNDAKDLKKATPLFFNLQHMVDIGDQDYDDDD